MKIVYEISYLLGTEEEHTEHPFLVFGADKLEQAKAMTKAFEEIKLFLFDTVVKSMKAAPIVIALMNLKDKSDEEIEAITQLKTIELVKNLVDQDIPQHLKKCICFYPKENNYYHLDIGAFTLNEVEVTEQL